MKNIKETLFQLSSDLNITGYLSRGIFVGGSYTGRLHPKADPKKYDIQVIKNVRYGSTAKENVLDVYVPPHAGPRPIVLYVHGGGFTICSKETHWVYALKFARAGYVVFNIDYRLAPGNPFPAAHHDAALSLAWVHEHGAAFGGDTHNIILAGESAGGNLVTSLALMNSIERDEPYAKAVFERNPAIKAVLPCCGYLQLTTPTRYLPKSDWLDRVTVDRAVLVSRGYLGDENRPHTKDTELAEPLLTLENRPKLSRPLPPFFITCGGRDLLVEQSGRLEQILLELGAHAEYKIYEGEPHAFNAFVMRPKAKESWQDTFNFLDRVLK